MASYHVITFGCQMNARDSEKLRGILESVGYEEARRPGGFCDLQHLYRTGERQYQALRAGWGSKNPGRKRTLI